MGFYYFNRKINKANIIIVVGFYEAFIRYSMLFVTVDPSLESLGSI